MTGKKKAVIAVVLGAAVAAGIYGFMGLPKKNAGISYILEPVTRGGLEFTISSTGTLSAVGTVAVGAQVSGTIDKVLAGYNDSVKKGRLLAVLDKTMFRLAVLENEAGVAKARSLYEQAERDYRRNEQLFAKKLISEMDYFSSKTNAATADAVLKSAVAALQRAETNLKYTEIRSPFDGKVIERNMEAGQTVVSNFSSPTLFTIAEDLDNMQIEADVDESDIGYIKEGQDVRFTVQAYPDENFNGTVRQIRLKPSVIQNVVNYKVIIDAANRSGRLLPGMTATIDFIVDRRKDVLRVPNSALRFVPGQAQDTTDGGAAAVQSAQAGGKGRVYLPGKYGTAEAVEVECGMTDGKMTELKGGGAIVEGTGVIVGVRKETEGAGRGLKLPPPPDGPGKPPF